MIATKRHGYELGPEEKISVGDRVRVKSLDFFTALPNTVRTVQLGHHGKSTQRCWQIKVTGSYKVWFWQEMQYLCGQILTIDKVTTRENLHYNPADPQNPKYVYEYQLTGLPYSHEYVFVNAMLERV